MSAHISRNAKNIDKEHALLPKSKQDPSVHTFTAEIKELCSQLCETGRQKRVDPHLAKVVKSMKSCCT